MPAASLGTVAVMGLLALAAVLGEWREAVEARRRADEARRQAERAGAAERWERYRANIGAAAAALQLQQSDTARRALEAAPREHRGWEWRHLRSQLDDSRAVLPGAKPPEVFLRPRPVISPTGDRIATIDGEGAAIRLWDATTGATVGLLCGHEGPVLVLCSSPDGKRLASGSADRTIRLWDPEGAKPVAVLRGHERPVEWLACTRSRAGGGDGRSDVRQVVSSACRTDARKATAGAPI